MRDSERITILSGVEVNILKDGSLDLENSILKEFDIVGARHSLTFFYIERGTNQETDNCNV